MTMRRPATTCRQAAHDKVAQVVIFVARRTQLRGVDLKDQAVKHGCGARGAHTHVRRHARPAEDLPGVGGVETHLSTVRHEHLEPDPALDDDVHRLVRIAFSEDDLARLYVPDGRHALDLADVLRFELLHPGYLLYCCVYFFHGVHWCLLYE